MAKPFGGISDNGVEAGYVINFKLTGPLVSILSRFKPACRRLLHITTNYWGRKVQVFRNYDESIVLKLSAACSIVKEDDLNEKVLTKHGVFILFDQEKATAYLESEHATQADANSILQNVKQWRQKTYNIHKNCNTKLKSVIRKSNVQKQKALPPNDSVVSLRAGMRNQASEHVKEEQIEKLVCSESEAVQNVKGIRDDESEGAMENDPLKCRVLDDVNQYMATAHFASKIQQYLWSYEEIVLSLRTTCEAVLDPVTVLKELNKNNKFENKVFQMHRSFCKLRHAHMTKPAVQMESPIPTLKVIKESHLRHNGKRNRNKSKRYKKKNKKKERTQKKSNQTLMEMTIDQFFLDQCLEKDKRDFRTRFFDLDDVTSKLHKLDKDILKGFQHLDIAEACVYPARRKKGPRRPPAATGNTTSGTSQEITVTNGLSLEPSEPTRTTPLSQPSEATDSNRQPEMQVTSGISAFHGWSNVTPTTSVTKSLIYERVLQTRLKGNHSPLPAPVLPPKHVRYSEYDARLKSFTIGWPTDKQKPAKLAVNGFFYTGAVLTTFLDTSSS